MKFAIFAILTAAFCLAQDAVTVTIKSTTDGTTRTVALTGEAATSIIQAAEYVAKTSCNPTCLYTNNVDVVRQNLAAFAIAVLPGISGSKLATLTTAEKAAQKALDDENKRVQSLVNTVVISETKP